MMERHLGSEQNTMADMLMKSAILFLLSFGVGSIALHAVSALPLNVSKPRVERTISLAPPPDVSDTLPDHGLASPDGPAVAEHAPAPNTVTEAAPPARSMPDVAAVIFPEDPPDVPRFSPNPEPAPLVVRLPRTRPEPPAKPPEPITIRAVATAAMPTLKEVARTVAVIRLPDPPPAPPVMLVTAPPLPQPPPDWRPGSDRLRHATLEALERLRETGAPLLGADLEAFAKMLNAYAEMRWQARGLEIGRRATLLDRRIVERTGELARAGRITPNQFPRRARSFIDAASHTVPALAPVSDDLAGEPRPFRWW